MVSTKLSSLLLAFGLLVPCLSQVPDNVSPCMNNANCKEGPDKDKMAQCRAIPNDEDFKSVAKYLNTHLSEEYKSSVFSEMVEEFCNSDDQDDLFKKSSSTFTKFYLDECANPLSEDSCTRWGDTLDCAMNLVEEMDADDRCKN